MSLSACLESLHHTTALSALAECQPYKIQIESTVFCYNGATNFNIIPTVEKTHTISFRRFMAPRFWPTWLGLGCLFLIAYLPLPLRIKTGSLLGKLTGMLGRERLYITRINIRLCFPELSAQEQEELVWQSFRENGIGLIETTTGWIRSPESFQKLLEIRGLENFNSALALGKGVLLLGAHFSTLDFTANIVSLEVPFGATYRPHKNPLFDAFMLRGRLKHCNGVFDRNDLRGAFRHLKQGKALWYAPDQDYGPDHAVFVPFFGQMAATITAASRFAEINQSPTLLVRHYRQADNRHYIVEFSPALENFPSGNKHADALQVNQQLEKAIRAYPAQYLWMHKRFKTQPGGKPESPYIFIRNKPKTITREQFNSIISASSRSEFPEEYTYVLDDGLYLKTYQGNSTGRKFRQHPALHFDQLGKQLRASGILAPTVRSIFLIKGENITVITFFSMQGLSLDQAETAELSMANMAATLQNLHQHGFKILNEKTLSVSADKKIFINGRLAVEHHPFDLCYDDRLQNLEMLIDRINLNSNQQQNLIKGYLQDSRLGTNVDFMKLLDSRFFTGRQ